MEWSGAERADIACGALALQLETCVVRTMRLDQGLVPIGVGQSEGGVVVLER